jgi:hypothetical protein
VHAFGFFAVALLLYHTPAQGQFLRTIVGWTTVAPVLDLWSLSSDTSNRSVVGVAASYSEMFRAEQRSESAKVSESQARAWDGGLSFATKGRIIGASVALGSDGLGMEAGDWAADRGASVEQQVSMVGVALWGVGKLVSAGLSLEVAQSPVAHPGAAGEDLLPNQPAVWLATDSSLGYSFFAKATTSGFALQYRQSRHTLAALLPRMSLLSSNHFRTFPLAVAAGERSLVFSYGGIGLNVEVRGGVEQLGTYGAQADNMLGTASEWLFRVGEVKADVRVRSVGVALELVGRIGGGYVEGYGKGIKYLVIDSAEVFHLGGRVHLDLPCRLRCGAFADYVRGESPIGSVNIAPFTAWSVFRPTVYRLRDMEVECREAGGEVGGVLRTGRRGALSCDISLAWVSAKVAYSTLERRIIVLIPAYFDSTRVSALDWEGVVAGIRVRHEITFRRAVVAYWLNQLLPIQTNAGEGEPGTDSEPQPSEAAETRSGGGTSVGLEIRIDVGRRAKRLVS